MKTEKEHEEKHIGLPKIRTDIIKFILSSPCKFTGTCSTRYFRMDSAESLRRGDTLSPKYGEPQHRYYFEISMVVPKEKHRVILTNYEDWAEDVAMHTTLLTGKMFQNEGVTLCRGHPSVVSIGGNQKKINKQLPVFSETPRVDFSFENKLNNMSAMYGLLISIHNSDSGREYSKRCFCSALSAYYRGILLYEEEPMIAYNCFITALEALALYDPKEKTHSNDKVTNRFIKFIMGCLDDKFRERTECQEAHLSLPKSNTKLKCMLNSAYEIRSTYTHTGLYCHAYMSPCHLNKGEEMQPPTLLADGGKIFESKLRESPTLIGMERITRHCLIASLLKEGYLEAKNNTISG